VLTLLTYITVAVTVQRGHYVLTYTLALQKGEVNLGHPDSHVLKISAPRSTKRVAR
jgi:hypothetical protein